MSSGETTTVGDSPLDGASPRDLRELRLESVSKSYHGASAPAVADLDLAIRPGEFFSLLGPSGSGKTTTLRMIAGFEAPTTGRVLLGDSDITELPPFRRPVHTVFQSYALFPHMTVVQNIAYPLRMQKMAKREIPSKVEEMLEFMAIAPFRDRMPHQLSGGQRQRVALARALVSRPQLVLLDEPLGALDRKLREEMQVVLQHLQRDIGITFVYVTHDQGEALAMSDRIGIMADGRLHQVASPAEVYAKPSTAFVARFVGRTNLLEVRAAGDHRAEAGTLLLSVADAPAQSSRYFVSIRPESLVIGEAADACDNHFEGIVRESIYQGHEIDLRIAVGEDHVLQARAPVGRIAVGDCVRLGWDAADAVAVQPDPTPDSEVEET